jgi:hypothetical protein
MNYKYKGWMHHSMQELGFVLLLGDLGVVGVWILELEPLVARFTKNLKLWKNIEVDRNLSYKCVKFLFV